MKILTLLFTLLYSCIASAADWELEKEKDGIKVFLREFPGAEGAKSFKSIAVFKAGYLDVVNTIGNPEKMAKVIHLVESSEIKRNIMHDYALYAVVDMPWPVTDRDLVWTVKKESQTEQSTLFNLGLENNLAVTNPDYVRFNKVSGSFLVENLGDDNTKVTWEQFNDLGGSIPTMILNSAAIDVGFESLKNLRDVAVPEKLAH